MSGGGNNEFVEERCVPMRRGGNAPKPHVLPIELKPKFPKAEEIMPVDQPQTPQTPQTPIIEPSPVVKTLEQDVENGVQNGDVDSGNQEVVSKDAETPDQLEPKKKNKKKSKKPKKKDEERAMAVFMDDDEPKKDDPNNAIGQFVDEEEEEKKIKKKEKVVDKPDKPDKPEKPEKPDRQRTVEKEKDSDKEKIKEAREKQKAKHKTQRQKQPRTESLRQKQKTTQSGRQKKTQASVRKTGAKAAAVAPAPPAQPAKPGAPKPTTSGQVPIPSPAQAPAAKPAVPVMTPEQKAAKEKERLAKEPNEGFLKAMYSRAKQKIVAMSKNPNVVPSETSISDDTLIATEAVVIKPEVTAVYGAASDYPKGLIPPKNDKNHPDKLFPGGRPFWMNRDEKPPQARVIMMGVVEQCLKQKTIVFSDNPPRKNPFTPYCENYQTLQRTDADHFTSYKLILSNTSRNCCVMRAASIKASESDKLKPRKKSTVPKKAKPISIPPMCQVYTRKDQKKKPPCVNKPITMGKTKKKKTKKASSNNSNSQAD